MLASGAIGNEKRKKNRIVWAGPALASDRLILVGSNGEALSLSPYSGSVLGKVELDSAASLTPVFANSTMYLLDDDGQLATHYRSTGRCTRRNWRTSRAGSSTFSASECKVNHEPGRLRP